MPRDGSVRSLSLNGAIGSLKHRGHETKRTVALRDDIGLHIAIVVLAGPNEATVGLDGVSDHVINETVLIPEIRSLELGPVVLLVDLLEDILEATVVSF
jgi:hypothetical protein